LVVQRVDGFMSADFGYGGGSLTTPLVLFNGKRLQLNVNASALGMLHVELRDSGGKVIPGFAAEQRDVIQGNHVAVEVTWQGKSDLSAVAGKPARIDFTGRAAKLYAFQFTE